MVLLSGIFLDKIFSLRLKYLRRVVFFALIFFCAFQLMESLAWVNLKVKSDLRQSSSVWIVKNIPSGGVIGIENIPIYQFLPDLVLKEFYTKRHNSNSITNFNYEIIDVGLTKLPAYIIISNENIDMNYLNESLKKNLVFRLRNEGYNKIYYNKQKFNLLGLFRSKLNYFMSGMVQEPTSISIYQRKAKGI